MRAKQAILGADLRATLSIICHSNSFGKVMIALRKSPALLLLMLGLFALTSFGAWAEETPAQDARLIEIIAGDQRSAENKARDKYRNPYQTLTFFGIKPDMTVVEIYPGRGWYTEILAPYLKDSGTLYAAEHPGDPSYEAVQRSLAAFDDMVKAAPELYGEVKRTKLTKDADIAPPGSADLVVTFRNTHSWMGAGTADEAFAAMFKALKPGGVLGLVQHRGNPDVAQDPKAGTGYVTENYLIELAKKAGFELAEKSEINANPKDTKDYAKGVWTLPPTLRLGDEDREKYLAIGESDRMTLKFVKPAG
jgi:predicted methyltransferase